MINTDHLYSFIFLADEPNMKAKESVLCIFYGDINDTAIELYVLIIFFSVLFKLTMFFLTRISLLNQLCCSSFLAFGFRGKCILLW